MFGEKLTTKLNKIEKDIELIIEPGRAAIASCGMLLTRVISVKWQDSKQIIGTDTSILVTSKINLQTDFTQSYYTRIGNYS